MTTRVIHVSEMSQHPDAIYIGRAMPRKGLKANAWSNPYRIGARATHWIQADPITRDGAILAYTIDILYEGKQHLLARLPELRDRPLACWCRHDGVPMTHGTNGPDNRCHADWLVHMINVHTDEELIEMAQENDPT